MANYKIVIGSHLDTKRLRDFEGLKHEYLPDGKTVLSGDLRDQPELYSILGKIRDMNMKLILVERNDEVEELK